jgi:beta-N-acetylhexosaminidase
LPDERGTGQKPPRAVILGCASERLSAEERRFFAAADPLGFILFGRNCQNPNQLRGLVAELRSAIGRGDAPVLIDQEGGRVARLKPPHWRTSPAPVQIGLLPDPLAGEAARLAAWLMGDELAAVGITVDCAPVLDLPARDSDPVIGDRAFGIDPGRVARLGRAFCEGLLAAGVLPVIKHIPGHGRARVDSHVACPRVETGRAVLATSDFAPFKALSAIPWAMTAHVLFTAIDGTQPVTFSRRMIETVIRGEIGFGGVLISDDIAMGALEGGLGERTRRAIEAGCDLVLHCSGIIAETAAVVEAAPPLAPAAQARIARAEALRRRSRQDFDRRAAAARFAELMSGPGNTGRAPT